MSMHMTWDGHDRIVDIAEFVQSLEDALGREPVAIALADLDGFGPLNDELGRDAGDAVLAAWVATLTSSLPRDAIVRRLGGDEFAVALPGTSAENALILFEEVRQHLAERPVQGVGRAIDSTIGVAARPPHGDDLADVVRCANAALMRGKREGGARVAIYVEEKMVLKSNYYPRADLDRLARLATATSRTEASLLREALVDLFAKHRAEA